MRITRATIKQVIMVSIVKFDVDDNNDNKITIVIARTKTIIRIWY